MFESRAENKVHKKQQQQQQTHLMVHIVFHFDSRLNRLKLFAESIGKKRMYFYPF